MTSKFCLEKSQQNDSLSIPMSIIWMPLSGLCIFPKVQSMVGNMPQRHWLYRTQECMATLSPTYNWHGYSE